MHMHQTHHVGMSMGMGSQSPTHTHTHRYPYPQPMWVCCTHADAYVVLGVVVVKGAAWWWTRYGGLVTGHKSIHMGV